MSDKSKAGDFTGQLAQYRQLVGTDIATYADHVRTFTQQQYGDYGTAVTGAFLDMLERGGKRLRGALVMAGYEMLGGRDQTMIARAATAIEMVHTYWLVIDDIQDRSPLRRGKPTVHKMLAEYLRERHAKGDVEHGGVSLALNAAVAGGHAAQMLIAGLSVDAELRSKAMGIVSQAAMVTGYGQTYDIMNELSDDVPLGDIERTLEWKTSFYTFLNPLCVGMVLAGAGCEDTDAIREYALPAGKAFQITDDIMGIFGQDEVTGKSSMDDLREGKQTLLTYHALTNASLSDKKFLRSCLGDPKLSSKDAERCRQIIEDSGALEFARREAEKHTREALRALDHAPSHWGAGQTSFLRELAKSLPTRVK